MQHKKVNLLDTDAYVVGLTFFPPSLTSKLNVQVVKTMATAAGINLPKRQNLKETLITLGRELYSAGKVELSKTAGLTRSDIEHK